MSTGAAIQAHMSARFDPASITQDSVRLWRGGERVTVRVTSDLGGVVTLSPEAPLQADAEYRVEITAALKSATGDALKPFASSFRTGPARPRRTALALYRPFAKRKSAPPKA